jgi:nucleoside-diphosphate-sugar epimerase
MKLLVLGATGATGRFVVKELLATGHQVKVIVRSADKMKELVGQHENLEIMEAVLPELSEEELAKVIEDVDGVASCLGHRGIYSRPWRLVTDAVKIVFTIIQKSNNTGKPKKYVLMNTTGVRNRGSDEKHTIGENIVLGLVRVLLPPHPDNEQAAEFLRTQVGAGNPKLEWSVVRPDDLINEDETKPYEIHPSPIRSSIFNAGKTSRINVGHFMAHLLTDDDLWQQWKNKMPVIYNSENA